MTTDHQFRVRNGQGQSVEQRIFELFSQSSPEWGMQFVNHTSRRAG